MAVGSPRSSAINILRTTNNTQGDREANFHAVEGGYYEYSGVARRATVRSLRANCTKVTIGYPGMDTGTYALTMTGDAFEFQVK